MLLRVPPGMLDDGGCAHDEQPPEIAIALFGNAAELLLAACRILARNETDPGREIATRLEELGSVTVDVMAVAPITPIPGTVSTRRLTSLARCCAWMPRSS